MSAAAADLHRLTRLFGLPPDGLLPMPSRGVAHDHYRIVDAGLVLRIPRVQALQGLPPAAALTRQAAAFRRAAATGHAPQLGNVIPPGDDLPYGALLVAEIVGRPPRLPEDLPAIATALAALHALPVPPAGERAPLESDAAPAAALLGFVRGRMGLFAHAGVEPAVVSLLQGELATAAAEVAVLSAAGADGPTRLIGVDVHPGNFLIDADGVAVLTDLERARYGHAGADLAHATLLTSTRWDPAVAATLSDVDVQAFYATWEFMAGDDLAAACRPAFSALRRLVWLRTLTWMAHWRAGGREQAPAMPPALLRHMDDHAAETLSESRVRQVATELPRP